MVTFRTMTPSRMIQTQDKTLAIDLKARLSNDDRRVWGNRSWCGSTSEILSVSILKRLSQKSLGKNPLRFQ